jgi:hypothetical protein
MVSGSGLRLEPRLCPACEEWFDAPSFAGRGAVCVPCEGGRPGRARDRRARRAALLARWPPVGDLPAVLSRPSSG